MKSNTDRKLSSYTRYQNFIRHIVPFFPKRQALVTLCGYYINAYYGENNTDMFTDGEIDFITSYISKEPQINIFDIGANTGNWTEAVLAINPQAEIHCFEPCISTYNSLLGKKFPPNVTCNNIGLGDRSEVKQLHVFSDNPEWNSFYNRPGQSHQSIQDLQNVQVDTVSDYCLKAGINYIEFMKIDVEGSELKVLQGATQMMAEQRIHFIQFEYAVTFVYAGATLKAIFDLAKLYNYQVYKIRPRGLIPIPEFHIHLENFANANYVLANKEGLKKTT